MLEIRTTRVVPWGPIQLNCTRSSHNLGWRFLIVERRSWWISSLQHQDTWKSACPSSLPDPHSIRYIHCRNIYPSHPYNPSAFLHTPQKPHLHEYTSHQPLRSGMRCLLLNLLLGAFAFLVPFPHRSCDATLGARMGLAARTSLPVKLALPASLALASSS